MPCRKTTGTPASRTPASVRAIDSAACMWDARTHPCYDKKGVDSTSTHCARSACWMFGVRLVGSVNNAMLEGGNVTGIPIVADVNRAVTRAETPQASGALATLKS